MLRTFEVLSHMLGFDTGVRRFVPETIPIVCYGIKNGGETVDWNFALQYMHPWVEEHVCRQ